MSGALGATNLILGIMAASLIEAIAIAGMGMAGFLALRRVMTVIATIEMRQVAPVMARVAILDDVKGVTSRLREETERVDQATHTTIDRIDDTADRMRYRAYGPRRAA